MSVHVVTASDLAQAMQRIRKNYGSEAVIVNIRHVESYDRSLVEVLVAQAQCDM